MPPNGETDLRPALELAHREVTKLQQQLSDAEAQSRQSSLTAANIQQQLDAEQGERKKINDEKEALSQQLTVVQTEAQSLRDKSTEAGATTAEQVA